MKEWRISSKLLHQHKNAKRNSMAEALWSSLSLQHVSSWYHHHHHHHEFTVLSSELGLFNLRERERDHKLGWQFLVHATINDWERNSNECRNIRPQQKAKKNALRNFYKILDQNGKRWNPNCDREGGASSYIFIIIIITMDCESSENLWHEISEDRRCVRF